MAKRSLPKKTMSPDLQAKLAAAEKEAQKFNSMKKATGDKTKAIYNDQAAFNIEEEMKALRDGNIIDKAWQQNTVENFTMAKKPEQMEHDALEAAGFTAEAAQMKSEEQGQTKEEKEEKQQPPQPMSQDEKLNLVAKELNSRFGDKAPTIDHLKQWKANFHNIFVLDLDEDRIFIYRYLNRQEWKQINSDQGWMNMPPLKKEEYIVNKCLLWPRYSVMEMAALPGGAYTMLSEQIQLQSMFLPAPQVADITMKI